AHETTRAQAVTLLRMTRLLNFLKHLIDHEEAVPVPEPYRKQDLRDTGREHVGLRLLAWFLNDGVIRGVTRAGKVYEHRTAKQLSDEFLDGIRKIQVRGSRPRSAP
ncbi:MAG: radical SAM protein, partial [Desulfobacterales bacterium]